MEENLAQLIETLRSNAALFVFLGLVLENSIFLGLIVPGLTLLIAAGYLMATGELNPWLGVAAGISGTLIGDNIHYALGRWGLRRFRWVRNLLDKSDEVYDFLHRRSKWAYLFFHFPVYLRTIMPMALGASRYPLKTWYWIDLSAAFLFNAAYISLGYVLGGLSGDLVGAGKAGNVVALGFSAVFIYWTYLFVRILLRKKRAGDTGVNEEFTTHDSRFTEE